MDKKDYYSILGIDKTADKDTIHRAYLKQCKKYHPDAQSGKTEEEKKQAEEQMKLVNEANDVLSDPQKRQYYDNFGTTEGMNRGGGWEQTDPMREFMRRHMGGFGFNPFGDDSSMYGGSEERFDPKAPRNGRNVRIRMDIPFEESIYGVTKEFSVKVNDPCEHCFGTGAENGEMDTCPVCHGNGMEISRRGMMIMQQTCHHCHGTGKVVKKHCTHCNGSGTIQKDKDVKIDIPQGIWTGSKLEVTGCGEKGINGGTDGNLIIVINVLDNDIFERDDSSIATTAYISSITASLGGDIDIQTPWGLANLKIPSGITSGKVFRVNGQGVHTKNGNGDLFVKIEIEPITNISEEQKELLEKLNKTIKDDNLKKTTEYKKKCKEFHKVMKKLKKDD